MVTIDTDSRVGPIPGQLATPVPARLLAELPRIPAARGPGPLSRPAPAALVRRGPSAPRRGGPGAADVVHLGAPLHQDPKFRRLDGAPPRPAPDHNGPVGQLHRHVVRPAGHHAAYGAGDLPRGFGEDGRG